MKPVDVIEALTKTNPAVAKFILAGLAVFAAAAIAASFKDIDTAVLTGTYVLVFAVVATILAHLPTDGPFIQFIGRALLIVIFFAFVILLWGAILPRSSPLPSNACILRFWLPCDLAADQSADRIAPTVAVEPVTDPATPQAAFDRSKYTIWLQFAGYKREDIVALAITLKNAGWNVPSAEKGGQRTAAADGYAEVRYRTSAEKAAAELLAKELNETGVKKGITAVEAPGIDPGKLEVWIGL